jgi:hypothetical protein
VDGTVAAVCADHRVHCMGINTVVEVNVGQHAKRPDSSTGAAHCVDPPVIGLLLEVLDYTVLSSTALPILA